MPKMGTVTIWVTVTICFLGGCFPGGVLPGGGSSLGYFPGGVWSGGYLSGRGGVGWWYPSMH